jgi:hypothetical protein
MGKKSRIRSDAGDLVGRPGGLDAQIERDRLARTRPQPRKKEKRGVHKQVDDEDGGKRRTGESEV